MPIIRRKWLGIVDLKPVYIDKSDEVMVIITYLKTVAPATPDLRQYPIQEFVRKVNMSNRLANILISMSMNLTDVNFVADINKKQFLLYRGAGIGTWQEFETILSEQVGHTKK